MPELLVHARRATRLAALRDHTGPVEERAPTSFPLPPTATILARRSFVIIAA
jgi:hypothetical protein